MNKRNLSKTVTTTTATTTTTTLKRSKFNNGDNYKSNNTEMLEIFMIKTHYLGVRLCVILLCEKSLTATNKMHSPLNFNFA